MFFSSVSLLTCLLTKVHVATCIINISTKVSVQVYVRTYLPAAQRMITRVRSAAHNGTFNALVVCLFNTLLYSNADGQIQLRGVCKLAPGPSPLQKTSQARSMDTDFRPPLSGLPAIVSSTVESNYFRMAIMSIQSAYAWGGIALDAVQGLRTHRPRKLLLSMALHSYLVTHCLAM